MRQQRITVAICSVQLQSVTEHVWRRLHDGLSSQTMIRRHCGISANSSAIYKFHDLLTLLAYLFKQFVGRTRLLNDMAYSF